MAATLALSSKQFSGAPHLAALHSNLTRAGYTSNSKPAKNDPMSAYRNNLNRASLGSATSSHSLGKALNESGGSMYGHSETSASTPKKAKAKTGVMGHPSASGKKGSGKRSIGSRIKALGNPGNNKRVLKAATGAK